MEFTNFQSNGSSSQASKKVVPEGNLIDFGQDSTNSASRSFQTGQNQQDSRIALQKCGIAFNQNDQNAGKIWCRK